MQLSQMQLNLNVNIASMFTAVAGVAVILLVAWYQWRKRKMEKREVQRLVEDIIGKFLCDCSILKRSVQVQYNYDTTAIQEFFLALQLKCICTDHCNTMLHYKFSTTCRKFAGYLLQL